MIIQAFAEPLTIGEPRISQGHIIKESCDIMSRSLSKKIIALPSLDAIGTHVIEI